MVIILNFGSQFAHLIARRVRDLGVKAEILPFDTPVSKILEHNPVGIILSGGAFIGFRKEESKTGQRYI